MITELLAAAGLLIAFYIFIMVRKKKQLVCPIGKDCNTVVESKYGRLFGIRNEILGMLYYGTVLVVALFGIPVAHWLALLVCGGAAAMAILLLGIQAFVLKEWCDYCIGSSVITLSIFVVQLLS